MADFVFTFTPDERQRFRSGELARRWAEEFPKLFSSADLEIALNQPQYHFYEWLAAVRLHDHHGWLSLVETYQFNRHTAAHALFRELVPAEVANLLDWRRDGPRTQGPDLFVYRATRDEWFFLEVKGPRDRIRPNQAAFFDRIAELTGKPVQIALCEEAG